MPEYPLFHLPEIGWLVAYRKATSHVELTGALRKQHSEYQKATLQEMEKSERAKQLNKHRHATILIVAGAIKNNTYKIIHWLSVVIGGRGILRITSIHAAHQFELRVTAMDQVGHRGANLHCGCRAPTQPSPQDISTKCRVGQRIGQTWKLLSVA